jgi:hypothetical protein
MFCKTPASAHINILSHDRVWLYMVGLMNGFAGLFATVCDYTSVDTFLPPGSQTVPDLSYQLLTARAHNNWTPAVL